MSSPVFFPPSYGAFAKTGLFKVDAKDIQHSVRLVNRSNSKQGVTFEPSVVYKQNEPVRGSLKTAFGVNGFNVDTTIETDASKASSIVVKRRALFPGVNGSVTLATSDRDFSSEGSSEASLLSKPKYGVFETFTADYVRNHVAATGSVTTDLARNHSAAASVAVGFNDVTVGGDVKIIKKGAEQSFKVKDYNAGITSVIKNYTLALTTEDTMQKIKATVLAAKMTQDKNVNLGVQAKFDLHAPVSSDPSAPSSRKWEVIVAAENIISPNTTQKVAVVLPKNQFVASVEHRLAKPNVMIGFNGQFGAPDSLYSAFPFQKFGVSVTMGDY